jgi:outer membrane receptor protein involved in Fe transport
MSAITIDVTIASTGVPQKIAQTGLPALPTVTMGGVTSVAGGATQTPSQILFQSSATNTADVVVRAGVGGGLVLVKAGAIIDVRPQGGVTLDDFSLVGTANDVVHVMLVG